MLLLVCFKPCKHRLPLIVYWRPNESNGFQSFASGCIELGAPCALICNPNTKLRILCVLTWNKTIPVLLLVCLKPCKHLSPIDRQMASKRIQSIPVFRVGLHRVGSAFCADCEPKNQVEDPLCTLLEQDNPRAAVGMPQALQTSSPIDRLLASKRIQSIPVFRVGLNRVCEHGCCADF